MGTSNGSPNEQSISNGIGSSGSGDESDNEFLYPGATEESEQSPQYQMPAVVSQPHPSPAQLEALYAAASAGDLVLLQRTLRSALASSDVGAFALANDASPRTGLTALHAAASRGYVDIVKWRKHIGLSGIQWLMMPSLYSDRGMRCNARLGRQGRRGKHMFILLLERARRIHWQTALHKTSLHGHLQVVKYLLPDRADVHARDADGWTALHNACSKVKGVTIHLDHVADLLTG